MAVRLTFSFDFEGQGDEFGSRDSRRGSFTVETVDPMPTEEKGWLLAKLVRSLADGGFEAIDVLAEALATFTSREFSEHPGAYVIDAANDYSNQARLKREAGMTRA